VEFFVTVGYVGRSPYASGTAGTFVAAVMISLLPGTAAVLPLFMISTLLGLFLCRPAIEILGSKDPQAFVLDEFAGFALAVLFLPKTWPVMIAAFALFRFFDTLKPLGIRKLDQLNHPTSIMWDDLLAGLYTNLILQTILRLT
jgi:phosphatidylglycerophosphatase A